VIGLDIPTLELMEALTAKTGGKYPFSLDFGGI
jgi:hypothetical protein